MKKKLLLILIWIVTIALIEFGLCLAVMDSAFRNIESVQLLILMLIITLPFLILGTYSSIPKFSISVSLLASTLCLIYFITYYQLDLINTWLVSFPLGYILILIMQRRIYNWGKY